MIRTSSILFAACLALLSFAGHAATASYSMKIVASAPKGSAGGDASKNKTLPVATTFTPCAADCEFRAFGG